MLQTFNDIAGGLIRNTRLHDVVRKHRGNRAVWVKCRRPSADAMIAAGAPFLLVSNSGILMFVSVSRWQRWELYCYELLHGGEGYSCGMSGSRGMWQAELPGRSLRAFAQDHALTIDMVRAAAMELRRCHSLHCTHFAGPWSHGDPHLGNILFDPSAARARLIDFETRHEAHRPPTWRHADDLLTFLLELVATLPQDKWEPYIADVIDGYGDLFVARALGSRLAHVSRLEWLLWVSRAAGLSSDRLHDAVDRMRRVIRRQT